ncbi:hypothetical protein ACL02T_25750 [Pseudonocardia sp. RS010]|uniref:hypothetical protein n=1 Tax=Pseudonocardia sp. RS010 TaxID=3385979 RepID=UPI0039A1FB3A
MPDPVDATLRLTHVGGPTLLVETAGPRILTDPTFDPPGRRYGFGWVARRPTVDVAVLHLGCVRFPVTGPLRYSMTGEQAVATCRALHPRVVVPVHYEGRSHFREGRAAVERGFAAAPDVRDRVRWLRPGGVTPVD